jgi:hypothetical protein
MIGSACQLCAKPLTGGPGPEVMDRQGHTYHLTCWSRHIDLLIAKRIVGTTARTVAQDKRLAARAKPSSPPDAGDRA